MDITSIIQHVFKQPSLEGVSLSELERFTAKQPFFAVGQYLLLRKMQDIRDPGFEKQLQKTRLYFENPLWLQQLLLRNNDAIIANGVQHEAAQPTIENLPTETEWVHNDEIVVEQEPKTEELAQIEPEEVLEEAPAADIYQETIVENYNISEPADQPIIEEVIHPSFEDSIEVSEPEEKVEHLNVVDLAEQEAVKAERVIIDEPVIQSLPENAEPVASTEEETVTRNIDSDLSDAPGVNEESEENEQGKPDFVLPVYTKPAEQTEDKLVFQAYHTVDYFASQGIKISHKAEMSDKLGTQLKSFTEWLKTMKRLPPSKMEQQMEEKETEVVVEMAAHSLESKEVLTETMAEVLLKQGKKESAIEVYNKLSLLNPSKTPYFAAKIEAIKQN